MGRRAGIALVLGLTLAACALRTTAPPEAPAEMPEDSDAPWNAARLAGAGFRAVGNEPGWMVEVYPDSLVYVTNYGEDRYRFPDYTATDAAPYVYEAAADGHTLTVTLSDEDCLDDMSGFPFETTVVLDFDGQTSRGCGRALD